jgi:hypothetical protein
MKKITRRHFIKNSAVLGAGIATCPTLISSNAKAGKTPKFKIHPNIDNLRVVGITDPSMTKDKLTGASWASLDNLVNEDTVSENIDKLACNLTETENHSEAWHAIFLKPQNKSWSETVVAIKTNNISRQHTRSAVMAKICNTLTDILGVRASNIHVYDACHGRDISSSTPFKGLPDGCRIENRWGGSSKNTAIPEPWKNGQNETKCLKHLVNGSVDILINIAMCKGHSDKFGGYTMTMKNHFGTFSPRPGHLPGSQDYLIAINKTPEILGEMDKKTGKVLFPRQQLCLVDAIWASKGGPSGNPTDQPNFLAMGVLSPAVDYQIATKFRAKKMGWKINMDVTRRMLYEFGYVEKDLPQGGKLIEV